MSTTAPNLIYFGRRWTYVGTVAVHVLTCCLKEEQKNTTNIGLLIQQKFKLKPFQILSINIFQNDNIKTLLTTLVLIGQLFTVRE